MMAFVKKQDVFVFLEFRLVAFRICTDRLIGRNITVKGARQVRTVVGGTHPFGCIPARVSELTLALVFQCVSRNHPADFFRNGRNKVLRENHGNKALSASRCH